MKNIVFFSVLLITLIGCKKNKHNDLIEKIETTRTAMNSNVVGINDSIANIYLSYLLEFNSKYPKDSLVPNYWLEAASIYRYMHQPLPALEIYRKTYMEYPTYFRHADCLFLQGMVLSNELNQKEEGIKVYKEFIEKYPTHFLTPQIEQLIQQMNLTDEELMKQFSKKNEGKIVN